MSADPDDTSTTQLPRLKHADLDDPARAMWDEVVAARGDAIVTGDGYLKGPFNAWLQAPASGRRLAELGATLRFESGLDPRLMEVAILTVAAHWKAEFECTAHAELARRQGVSPAAVDALLRGEQPTFGEPDEQIVYAAAARLAIAGTVDEPLRAQLHAVLGDAGAVELVCLCGYYAAVSYTLNVFGVAG